MPFDIKTLKQSRQDQNKKLNAAVKAMNQPFKKDDERFWVPSVDKAGNGAPTVRFLPQHPDEEIPFIRYWDHGFKGPGGWYIENSRTSLKQADGSPEPDPVTDYNKVLWNEGGKAGQDLVSGTPGNPGYKRRLHYISNVYIVDDPEHPENNGKVFLYKYGPEIFKKLDEVMNPKLDAKGQLRKGDRHFNPFDLWEGANFVIKMSNDASKGNRRTYSAAFFEPEGPLFDTDKEMQKVWEQVHPLQQFLNPALFKSYDELQNKLDRVLNGRTSNKTVEEEDKVITKTHESFGDRKEAKKPEIKKEDAPPWETDDDEEYDVNAFKELASR